MSSNVNQSKRIPLAQQVVDWIDCVASGVFSVKDIDQDLGLRTKEEKQNRSQALTRLTVSGIIVRHGAKYGIFRKKDTTLRKMDLLATEGEPHWVQLPLGIHKMVKIFPGSLIAVGGEKDLGKTAFLINTCIINFIECRKRQQRIHFWNSESSGDEFRSRLEAVDKLREWVGAVDTYLRETSFEDVVIPDDINIIDYLKSPDPEKPYLIGPELDKIHSVMRQGKGVAIIAMQKDAGKTWVRGGPAAFDAPRLTLFLQRDAIGQTCVLDKVKHFYAEAGNPRGYKGRYQIISGCKWRLLTDADSNDDGWIRP